jgi:ornithine cyclodeaminase/alanine dehydrogenase-like protein (mu-crystallin family)
MRVVSADELSRLLTMSDVIGLMRDAFVERGEGRAEIPDRAVIALPGTRDVVLVMPGALASLRAVGVKIVGVFPDNPAKHRRPVIKAQVFYIDPDTGDVGLMLDGTWVTGMRTGAVTGLATDLLARPDASHLVVFGTGPQAARQIEAVCAVRPIRRITMCGHSADKAASFVEAERAGRPEVTFEVASSPDAAVAAADVVVTATSSRTPVFDGRRLRPGVHVNAIGAFTPDARELDTEVITRGRVYVDDREHAWREAGDLRIPHDEGLFDHTAIVGDLGALVCGACEGRTDPRQITVFKSVGLSIEDVAVAARVWELTR